MPSHLASSIHTGFDAASPGVNPPLNDRFPPIISCLTGPDWKNRFDRIAALCGKLTSEFEGSPAPSFARIRVFCSRGIFLLSKYSRLSFLLFSRRGQSSRCNNDYYTPMYTRGNTTKASLREVLRG